MERRGLLPKGCCLSLSVVLVGMSVAGCASMKAGNGSSPDQVSEATLICGETGARTGAAIGEGVSHDWRGALIGGVGGAVVAGTACFAMAEYQSRQVRGYAETRQAVNYQPAQGGVVEVTQYAVTPAATSPGTQVVFKATYYVMTPNPDEDVPITETRIVNMYDRAAGGYKELGRVASQVTIKPGTRQADGKWEIRSGVAEGQYRVVFQVARSEQRDSKDLPLVVTTDPATLEAASNRVEKPSASGAKAPNPAASVGAREAPAASARPSQPVLGPSLASLGEQQPKAPATAAPAPTPPATPGEAKSAYFVASKVTGQGNVREGPGSTHEIVGGIRHGDRFLIIDRAAAPKGATLWYKIRLDSGREGWVAGSLGEEIRE
jgi:hypothetical protein